MGRLKAIYQEMNDFYAPKFKPTDGMYRMWRSEMEKFDLDIVEAMWQHLRDYAQPGDSMPSAQKCMVLCDSIRFNRWKAFEEKRKKEERDRGVAEFFGESGKDSLGRQAIRNITALLAGTKTREQFLVDAERIDINVYELKQFYTERGYDLTQPAGSKAKGKLLQFAGVK